MNIETHYVSPRQKAFVESDAPCITYNGSGQFGVGKTWALIMSALRFAQTPQARVLLVVGQQLGDALYVFHEHAKTIFVKHEWEQAPNIDQKQRYTWTKDSARIDVIASVGQLQTDARYDFIGVDNADSITQRNLSKLMSVYLVNGGRFRTTSDTRVDSRIDPHENPFLAAP